MGDSTAVPRRRRISPAYRCSRKAKNPSTLVIFDLVVECFWGLAGAGEIPVDVPGRQAPGHGVVEGAQLQDRLDQGLQGRWRQTSNIAGPQILRDRVLEERALVGWTRRLCSSTLQRAHVSEAGLLLMLLARPFPLIPAVAAVNDGEATSSGIRHEHAN
jgi:hypothetical protein